MVVLGKQFSSRTVAVASGVVCAILPRATWAGIEARPYAFSMMAAVWLTVLLVYAARRDNGWVWLSYGIVLAISILLDVYLVLLFLRTSLSSVSSGAAETVLVRFAMTSVLAGCALTPFVVAAIGQAHQISWIAPIGRRTIEDVTIQQYFERSPPFALLSALVVAAAIVLWLRTSAQLAESDRQLLTLAIGWLLIPTAADRHLVGVGSPHLHAALLGLHRTGDGTGPGRLHCRSSRLDPGQPRLSSVFSLWLRRRIMFWPNVTRTQSMEWTTARSPI